VDGDDIIFTWRYRLMAIPIICGLVGLFWLDDFLFGDTRLASVIATVLGMATIYFACVLVMGRLSDNAD
jgi:hypothetical protein